MASAPVRKKRITLFTGHLTGSNTVLLYKYMPEDIARKYDVHLEAFKSYDKMSEETRNSDVFVTTHGNHPALGDKILIELWHGFPLKCMANMDIDEPATQEDIAKYWQNVDLIMSYSDTYNTLFNACMGSHVDKYRVTGMPRNDALFAADSRQKMRRVLGTDYAGTRIVYYMPTFRQSSFHAHESDGRRHWFNPFGFDAFDTESFRQFLEEQRITLIVKLHPFEEELAKEHIARFGHPRLVLLTGEMLTNSGIDLYEILGASDALITDYSSVYFDYLLLDKPILFTPVDLEEYRRKRGFLLQPYELWTPGPKVLDQDTLQAELIRSLNDRGYYREERERIARIVHTYRDGQSSLRVWKAIDEYLERGGRSPARMEDELESLKSKMASYLTKLIEAGQIEQAKSAFGRYAQTVPLNAELLTVRAVLQYVEGNYPQAIEDLMRAHHMDSTNFDTLYNLAHIFDQIGDRICALHYYQKAGRHCADSELLKSIETRIAELQA